MVFSSPIFLFLFLPAVLAITWVVPPPVRRIVLLLAGFGFYAWGAQAFVLVMIASTLLDWLLARGMGAALERDDRRRASLLLVVGLVQNLGLLAWFKYAGFASEQAARFAELLGLQVGTLDVILPIGISFFTFEKISYLVDVRRADVEPRRNPVDLLLFVSLFPRSIAGPIVRLREIQDDLAAPKPTAELLQGGAIRFSHGLAKKVLIADQIAPIADAAFASAGDGTLTMTAAWIGAVAYALQLYFDFSGYSDMAIGIGMMLGFRFPENFNRPYSSLSITDFWRRWHMTLSRWFRDYVYIPLGGSRGTERQTSRNLLIVFTLTGIWHGADWAFLLWGLWHGAWLLIERRQGWRAVDDEAVARPWARRASTLLIVLLGWVIFRAGSMPLAIDYYAAMFTPTGGINPAVRFALTEQAVLILLLASLVVFLPRRQSGGRFLVEGVGTWVSVARVALLAVVLPLSLTLALASSSSPFLYFQF